MKTLGTALCVLGLMIVGFSLSKLITDFDSIKEKNKKNLVILLLAGCFMGITGGFILLTL